jgi:hypothetical protein
MGGCGIFIDSHTYVYIQMRTELALIRSLLAAELATGYSSGVGLFAKHGTLHHSCYLLNCYSCGHPSLQQDGVPTVKKASVEKTNK